MLTDRQQTISQSLAELLAAWGPNNKPDTEWNVIPDIGGVTIMISSVNDNCDVRTYERLAWSEVPSDVAGSLRMCIDVTRRLVKQWEFYYKAMNVARMEMEQQP